VARATEGDAESTAHPADAHDPDAQPGRSRCGQRLVLATWVRQNVCEPTAARSANRARR
jgi:hypothetical protein